MRENWGDIWKWIGNPIKLALLLQQKRIYTTAAQVWDNWESDVASSTAVTAAQAAAGAAVAVAEAVLQHHQQQNPQPNVLYIKSGWHNFSAKPNFERFSIYTYVTVTERQKTK